MKIAILTQPLYFNYGGILQAFALQQALKGMGHDAMIVNRVDNPSHGKIYRQLSTLKALLIKSFRCMIGQISFADLTLFIRDLYSPCHAFVKSAMNPCSPALFSDEQMIRYSQKKRFDAFVVGSD